MDDPFVVGGGVGDRQAAQDVFAELHHADQVLVAQAAANGLRRRAGDGHPVAFRHGTGRVQHQRHVERAVASRHLMPGRGLEPDAHQMLAVVQRMPHQVGGDGEPFGASGTPVAVVEGVGPFFGPHRIRVYVIAGSGPVEGQLERGSVGVQAESGEAVHFGGDEPGAPVVFEGRLIRFRAVVGLRFRRPGFFGRPPIRLPRIGPGHGPVRVVFRSVDAERMPFRFHRGRRGSGSGGDRRGGRGGRNSFRAGPGQQGLLPFPQVPRIRRNGFIARAAPSPAGGRQHRTRRQQRNGGFHLLHSNLLPVRLPFRRPRPPRKFPPHDLKGWELVLDRPHPPPLTLLPPLSATSRRLIRNSE